MPIFAKIWVSDSCGQLFIFKNVPYDGKEDSPFEDKGIEGWWDANNIDDVVDQEYSGCEWGEYESTKTIRTPKGGWEVEEDSDDEDSDDEDSDSDDDSEDGFGGMSVKSIVAAIEDEVKKEEEREDGDFWCENCESYVEVSCEDEGDSYFFEDMEMCSKCDFPVCGGGIWRATSLANTLVSRIMEDAVNRTKPCKKDQCLAMTTKGFRCKVKGRQDIGNGDFCWKHLPVSDYLEYRTQGGKGAPWWGK